MTTPDAGPHEGPCSLRGTWAIIQAMNRPRKASAFDVAAELQVAAVIHGQGKPSEDMAHKILDQLDPGEREDVPGIMAGLHGIHTMNGGREFMFKLCPAFGVSPGQMCGLMASTALIWITHSKNLGWEILDWLVKHQQLLDRQDIQDREMEQGMDFPSFLVSLWNSYTIMNEGGYEEWTREWSAKVIALIPGHANRLDTMLRDLAVDHKASFNSGFLLSCLDLGADWKTLMDDTRVTRAAWDVITQHPSWKRDQLDQLVPQQARAVPAQRGI